MSDVTYGTSEVCAACGDVIETGGWIGTPDPITYRGEVVR